jgi:hypothetical protein|tara:strand:+ start:1119 stop:1343 length:225 start_codon:yes stop_codon:yes gene_type:complete
MPEKVEFDCATGETTYTELTDEEIAANDVATAAALAAQAEIDTIQAKAATDAAAGKAKLKELGLTDDQIAALVG